MIYAYHYQVCRLREVASRSGHAHMSKALDVWVAGSVAVVWWCMGIAGTCKLEQRGGYVTSR
jgi:hypothetical protein